MNNKEIMGKISELEQQIAELKEAAQKQNEPKAWVPEEGEEYWYIQELLYAANAEFCDDCFDNNIIKCNNCFPTKERAEEVAKKIRMLLKLEQYHDMFCPDYVPNLEADNAKYFVAYNEEEKRWNCGMIFLIRDAVQVYFDSKETAQKVCDLLNGEDEENGSGNFI